MIRSKLCWLLLAFPLNLWSQTVEFSKEQHFRPEHEISIVGRVGTSFFLLKDELDKFEVQAFDEGMQQLWAKEVELERSNSKLLGVTTDGETMTLIYTFKEKGTTKVMARKYNPKLRLVDSTTIETFERRAFSPSFSVVYAQNRQVLLLYNVEKDKILEALAFDVRSMKRLWRHDFEPTDFYYRQNFLDFLVDNNGGAYLAVERNNKRSKKDDNRFEFLSFDGTTQETFFVSMAGDLWYDVAFSYDNLNRRIVATGFYANDAGTEAAGVFYWNINPKSSAGAAIQKTSFEQALIGEVVGKPDTKADGLSELEIRELVLREDGGVLLVSERERQYVRQITTMNHYSMYSPNRQFQNNQTDYYYNDVVLFSLHPSGVVHWWEVLHKRQFSQDDNGFYSSYFLMKSREGLRLIYNEEIKAETVVYEYIIKGNGQSERRAIMNTSGAKVLLAMRASRQISSNEVIIPSERRRQLKLIKLTY